MLFRTDKRIAELEKSLLIISNAVAQLQLVVIAMSKDLNPTKSAGDKAPKKRKHKKHTFKKSCNECGKTFRGTHGLSVHNSRIHGIPGKWLTK